MVMVTALVDGAEGAAGVEDPPPPPHDREQSTTPDAAVRTSRRRIRSPFLPLMPCASARAIPEIVAVFCAFAWWRVTACVSALRPPPHNHQPPTTNRGGVSA